jgi:TonB-dependent receptor
MIKQDRVRTEMQKSSGTQRKEGQTHVGQVRLVTALWLLLMTLSLQASAQKVVTGRIVGKIVGAESGEAIIGASVMLEGTKLGVAANLDGEYLINNVPVGTYRLIVSSVGRVKTVVEVVTVTAKGTARYNISLQPQEIVGQQIVVEGTRLYDTDASMLKERERSNSVTDAISSQSISRTGAGTAAAAMSRVTGASVVGGKYVLIRGLGGRYANTTLNGSLLPAADQEKQSVQLDIVPSNLLDNIIVQKTASPDKSGDFAGGSVNLNTKSIPDAMMLSFSTTSSYNSETTFRKDVLTFRGGANEWLGTDAVSHSRPGLFSQPGFSLPNPGNIGANDTATARMLDAATKALDNTFDFTKKRAPLNQSYAFSFGNRYSLWDRSLGVLASLSYNRNASFYDDGNRTRWGGGASGLNYEYSLTDVKATEDVLIGALASLAYQLSPSSRLNVMYNRNQSGQKQSRFMYGAFPRDFSEGTIWQTRVLQYTQRSMDALQLDGEHLVRWFKPIRVSWKGSYSKNTQEDPDRRFFSSAVTVYENDTIYNAGEGASFGGFPSHYWRDLSESNKEGQVDLEIPLEGSAKLKFGANYRSKNREQTEYMYAMASQATDVLPQYDGNPNDYYADSLLGIIGVTPVGNRYLFGRVVQGYPIFGNYTGTQKIASAYSMAEFSPLKHFDVIAGVRFESTRMDVLLKEKKKPEGHLSSNDWLPSVNLVFHLQRTMNLRGAFGMTLARPTLREMAPFGSWEFLNDYIFVGNPKLRRTLIYNYDLRWEWFTKPGEVLAVSAFYKKFIDPVEKYLSDYNDNATWNNVPDARVYGLEFELRQSLSMVPMLRRFSVSGNLTLARSRVALTENEYKTAKFYDANASRYRDFGGQSRYLVNTDLSYENQRSGTTASLVYNVFGRRLTENVEGQSPNIYEEPFNSLDLIASQRIWWGLKAKFAAKNILNDRFRKTQRLPGKEYVAEEYSVGKTFSLGISYEI